MDLLRVRTFAALADGTTCPDPRSYVRTQRKLRRAQQAFSRRDRGANHGYGSKRYNRALGRVRRIHARIAAQRADNIGKLTTWLADNYSDISIEDLNVQGMSHNRRLAEHILDADCHEFRRQLEYKTARAGTRLHVIDLAVSKLEDLLELRDGESQTAPVRTRLSGATSAGLTWTAT